MNASSQVVAIKPLIVLADQLQAMRHVSETHFHIASKLYQSLEDWQDAFKEVPALGAEKIYWLSFDSYHYANALVLLSDEVPEQLDTILATMQRVMDEYKPSDLEVVLSEAG